MSVPVQTGGTMGYIYLRSLAQFIAEIGNAALVAVRVAT
jgi:hypothetical protein